MSDSPPKSDNARPGQYTAMISSTALDLPTHRAAVHRACLDAGVFPIGMEALPAQDVSAISASLEMVNQADIYLGIYAWRYGWVPEGYDISITEMEFNRAAERQSGGQLREILIFTAHEEHPVVIKDVEIGDVPQAKLREFKTKASNGRIRKAFKSAEELHRQVSEALREFKSRQTKTHVPVVSEPVCFSNLPGGYIGRLFLGRETFLTTLRASLQKQTHATAITQVPAATGISGLGGIGKTHAAIEYAYQHRADYRALLFISGETPEKLRAGLAGLVSVLHLDQGGSLPADEDIRASSVLDWLASRHDWLLIVDNVDSKEAALFLTQHLARLATGHVLITSRVHAWPDNVESLDIEVLPIEAAAELLLQLTDKHRRKTFEDDKPARHLATLMEGLPLAVHQAVGYIRENAITLAAYLQLYDQEAARLLGWFESLLIPYAGPEELGPRPVLVTWKTSFDKLDTDTRFWLLVFSHFAPDPIPNFLLDSNPDADDETKSRHVAAQQALAQADTYSLLTRDLTLPRFKLHRLVQQIIRLTSSESDRIAAMSAGIQLINESNPGDPTDVRDWPRWNPLQSHAASLVSQAPDQPVIANLSWLLGGLSMLLQTKSLHQQAEPLIRRALQIDEISFGSDHPKVALRLINLASLLQDTNRLREAEPLMRRALQIDENSLGPEHPDVAIDLNNLAQLFQDTNRLVEAEPLMRRALQITEKSLGSDHPKIAIRLNNLAQLLQTTNRLAEAEPLMRRVLQINETSLGSCHPYVATSLSNLAILLKDSNRLTEAETLMHRALQIDENSFGSHHPNVAIRLNNLASLLQDTNRLTEAEPLMHRALQIVENSLGSDHPNVATSLNNLASLLQATNRLDEAESFIRRALQIDETSFGSDHPKVALRLNNLAFLLKATSRPTEAEPLMRRALSIIIRSLGLEHPSSQTMMNNYRSILEESELPGAGVEQRIHEVIQESSVT